MVTWNNYLNGQTDVPSRFKIRRTYVRFNRT